MVDLWRVWSPLRRHISQSCVLLALNLWWVSGASLPSGFASVYKALWRGDVARSSLCGCRKHQGAVFLWRWIEDIHGCVNCVPSSMWEQMFLCTEMSTEKWEVRGVQRPWHKVWKSAGISFFARTWALLFPESSCYHKLTEEVQKG